MDKDMSELEIELRGVWETIDAVIKEAENRAHPPVSEVK